MDITYLKNIRRQLMKVQSNERPDKVQVMGDKIYLNLDIKDISYSDENSNGVSMFEYIQFKFPHPVSDEVLLKTEKEYKLRTIVVTTQNGNTFDGNETARNNMTSAIISADVIGRTEEYWKLADNTVKLIQLAELKEALALSIQEVGSIVTAGVR